MSATANLSAPETIVIGTALGVPVVRTVDGGRRVAEFWIMVEEPGEAQGTRHLVQAWSDFLITTAEEVVRAGEGIMIEGTAVPHLVARSIRAIGPL